MNWINIDKLGTAGSEPDRLPQHRKPQSLDLGLNVRAIGPNIANAGGYKQVSGAPIDQHNITLFLVQAVDERPESRISLFDVQMVDERPDARITRFGVQEVAERNPARISTFLIQEVLQGGYPEV